MCEFLFPSKRSVTKKRFHFFSCFGDESSGNIFSAEIKNKCVGVRLPKKVEKE